MEEKIANLVKGFISLLPSRANAFSALVGICSQMNEWNAHLHRSVPVWVETDLGPGEQSSKTSHIIMKIGQ